MRGRMIVVLSAAAVFSCGVARAAGETDVLAYFQKAQQARGAGVARKTKPVDARRAKQGEIVVTVIKGEGEETRSAPAKAGDMVVRNRCAETGNEEILVSAAAFKKRYEGPPERKDAEGWDEYRPRGVEMNFIVVPEQEKGFAFIAPWGERMVARAGDLILQNPEKPEETYRIARMAFDCTYEVVKEPAK